MMVPSSYCSYWYAVMVRSGHTYSVQGDGYVLVMMICYEK
jgi:hypothetical protein